MDYRITKIRTKDGQMGTPITTSLDEVVSRMLSDKNTREVDQVAKRVTYALIDQQEKGWNTYRIESIDELPYLIFSSIFSRQGVQDFRQPTGLVLLSVDYGMDQQWMKAVDILSELNTHITGADRPSLKLLTLALKHGHYKYGAQDGIRGWYAKKR